MKHEDWVRYRRQETERRALLFRERPKTDAEKPALRSGPSGDEGSPSYAPRWTGWPAA